MEPKEADQITSMLFSGFPTQADKANELTFALWRGILIRFPYQVGVEAVQQFFLSRQDKQVGFLPSPDEFAQHMDRVWQRQAQRNTQRDQEQARLEHRREQEAQGDGESIATFARKLIEDLGEIGSGGGKGTLKYGSDEWHARRAEMDRRWPEHPKSCICEDGLVHYTVVKHALEYEKVARCTCGLGERHPYKHLRQMDPYTKARVA